MASICAKLVNGHDASCDAPVKRYLQKAVVMNFDDLEDVVIADPVDGACNYNVSFGLKTGATGYLFVGPAAGSNFVGSYSKKRGALGYPEYVHSAQILITGASEESKCIIDALDKGGYVVAYQLADGAIEIYGVRNGLTTGDYSYNLQDGGGGAPVILQSLDIAAESRLPLIYKSETADGEVADFDALFANPTV